MNGVGEQPIDFVHAAVITAAADRVHGERARREIVTEL